tara:strand:- start:136 stop:768 length:633 start_codon:yes stop_codon:yes gene_type:complete
MSIIGKSGSGKTNMLLNLLTKRGKMMNRKFDRVYLISPSLHTIDGDPFETIPDDQKYEDLTPEVLEEITTDMKDSGEKCLIVMDDVVAGIKDRKLEMAVAKLTYNRRHLCGAGGCCCLIITSQVYNRIPLSIRKNFSQLILFKSSNKRELKSIADEVALMPDKEFYEVLGYTFDKKHNFLYVDTTQNSDNMFYKNFNRLGIKSDNMLFNL